MSLRNLIVAIASSSSNWLWRLSGEAVSQH